MRDMQGIKKAVSGIEYSDIAITRKMLFLLFYDNNKRRPSRPVQFDHAT
jgi:hypothetical protein